MSILGPLATLKGALRLPSWSTVATWATTPASNARTPGARAARRYVERRNPVQLALNNAEFGLCSRCGTPRIGSTVMDVGVVVCPASDDGGRHDPPRHYRTVDAR